jgi:uncharacterized membrane protein (UPF0127 family)
MGNSARHIGGRIKERAMMAGLLVSALLLGACAKPEPMNRVVVEINGNPVSVEVARSPDQHEHGLMDRTKIPHRTGMLFVFEKPEKMSFWMRSTLIPLDILFFDSEQRLIAIHPWAEPCPDEVKDCPLYDSGQEAKYVLEVAGGEAQEMKAVLGTKLELANVQPNDANSK